MGGFVKKVGFKTTVKEWGSYRWREQWICWGRGYDRHRSRWLRDTETGMGL